jgi:hypothetical protein
MSEDGSDERTFLHDLASPLGTAMFLTDSVLDGVQSRPGVDPDELMQLGQIFEALEKMKKMLQDRREILIKRGVPSART